MKKFLKTLLFFIIVLVNSDLLANNTPKNFICTVNLMKNNCWGGHKIVVQPIDVVSQKPFGSPIILDKDSEQAQQNIPCHPNQAISFIATFSPAIWQEDANVQYPTNHFWQSPVALPPQASSWIISLCFANDFTSVPLPLEATATCTCNFQKIPNTQEIVPAV